MERTQAPDTLVLRDALSGVVRRRLRGHESRVFAVVFSPDNKSLASGTSDVRLWELITGQERCRLPIGARCLAISPDGKVLASGGPDNIVHLWSMATSREIGRFVGHDGWIVSLRFSHDGKRLASGSWDNTALIWDASAIPSRPSSGEAKLATAELSQLWADLTDTDATRAYRAIGALAAAPAQTVSFMRERLHLANEEETGAVKALVADLDNDDFGARDRAMDHLSRLGIAAWPALRAALSLRPSAEKRQRIERLLGAPLPVVSPEIRRISRAVEVLEQIGTAESDRLLDMLAKGSPQAWLTYEAQAAHNRRTQQLNSNR
jgi:hypothetical protein